MNIIFLGGFAYPEGMAGTKRVSSLINYLKAHQHQVHVIIIHNDPINLEKYGAQGSYKGIPFITIGKDLDFNILLPLRIIKLIYEIFIYLKNNRIKNDKNILYVYNGINYENILFVKIARLFHFKVVTDIVEDNLLIEEDLSYKTKLRTRSNNYFENKIVKSTHGIIVISHHLKNKLSIITKNSIPILLLPPCILIEPDHFKINQSSNVTRFFYAGTFGNKDGIALLINAFNNLSKIYNNCELILAGKPYNHKSYLNNSNPKIIFIGFIPEEEYKKELYNADVLCMTRINSGYANAGFPFKLVEYLSTGKPVIASNVSDVNIYLKDKIDAFLYSADNLDELITTMEYILNNPSKAANVGKRGLDSALKNFNVSVEGKKLIEYLENI